MQYDPKDIEQKWREKWQNDKTYRVLNDASKPKYYVLDMFPYPSGAGLHVGHPLGYIASDIVARFKRHQGFNVLHPMGYDSFGLPAEQYAIQTGQHPAKTTEENAARYRQQLDAIGFSFDWDREVRTSDPSFYKWTQWIFIQLFESWYDHEAQRARPIAELIARFEEQGWHPSDACALTGDVEEELGAFSATEWNAFDERTKQRILQHFRLAYLSEAWVNWCPALGTVLANDEVKDGVSERGGHPVERKRMPQWSMRITAYAQRLIDGLDTLDWSDSIKEAQRNWIGRSEGALVKFRLTPGPSRGEENISLTPGPSPRERGEMPVDLRFDTANRGLYDRLKDRARSMRREQTEAEAKLWEELRNGRLGEKFRRQHVIQDFIVDLVCLSKGLIVEVDGSAHDDQAEYDAYRTRQLEAYGFKVIRFSNDEVLNDTKRVVARVKDEITMLPSKVWPEGAFAAGGTDALATERTPLSFGEGPGVRLNSPLPGSGSIDESHFLLGDIEVFTTRPDTLFGVTFVTLAPEHELVELITPAERRDEVMAYVTMAKNRSERDRMADVKKVSGVFTGAYCIHPFTGKEVPVWVGDYVLGGYGTGAVMAVPGGDQRDWNFATHFGLPIIAVTEGADISKEADERKDATICSEGFLKGLKVPDAITRAIDELVKLGAGERRINYRLRDAAFGRQRYWGEPIPIYYKDGVPYALPESELPLKLPEVDKFLPTEDGEPPLARAANWSYQGHPLETTTMPGWAGSSWYFLRYMDPQNEGRFASPEAIDYWQQIDLYVGGSEHATGHLLYFRFWTKFLKDRGYINFDEPAKKLVNQGMIVGVSKYFQEVRVDPSIKAVWDKKPKQLHIRRNGTLLKSIEIPVPTAQDVTGHHVFCSYGCRLDLDFFDPATGDYIKTVRAEDRADSDFVSEAVIDSKSEYVIRPLDGWLRAEPVYRPIVITDRAVDAYWHYEPGKRQWLSFNDEPLENQELAFWTLRPEIEKMSKSKMNVVTPDEKLRKPIGLFAKHIGYYFNEADSIVRIPGIVEKYGADTLRLYEMFLGPLEQSKPWDTNGIEGTFRFLRKFWNLFFTGETPGQARSANAPAVTDEAPTKPELKVLHATLKKVTEDIEKMSFNTSVAQFMIAVNELGSLKCTKRAVLEPLVVALAPFAPHIAEELWQKLGHNTSITTAVWPKWDAHYLVEDNFSYPISFNGKTRLQLEFPIALDAKSVEAAVLANPEVQQRLEGKAPKKVIVVPKRIVNIVV